jgi:hypothetical protein
MLLDDIIAILSDSNGSLTDALLKTKVLLHQIGKKDLVPWVTHELGGYPSFDNFPPYRVVSCTVHASLISFSWTMNDYRPSLSHLKPEQRKNLTEAYIDLSISSLEEVGKEKGGALQRQLDPALGALFKKVLEPGVEIVSLWTVISPTHIEGILAQVRSRLLDFCLELQDVVGLQAAPQQIQAKAAEIDTEKMFNMAIYGGTVIVGGSGTQNIAIQNIKGDFEGLVAALKPLGLDKASTDELRAAIRADEASGKAPEVTEGETSKWYLKTLKAAGKGALKVGGDVVTKLAGAAIEHYSGLSR